MGKTQLKTMVLMLALVGIGTAHAQYNPNQDLDDDNDGIPDLLESPPSNTVVNGTFMGVHQHLG
ncbi:hypothetical protein [Chryseobacterium pennipullorum]|nr:hypothetical protein [Chryseobacterium pennipullorum]